MGNTPPAAQRPRTEQPFSAGASQIKKGKIDRGSERIATFFDALSPPFALPRGSPSPLGQSLTTLPHISFWAIMLSSKLAALLAILPAAAAFHGSLPSIRTPARHDAGTCMSAEPSGRRAALSLLGGAALGGFVTTGNDEAWALVKGLAPPENYGKGYVADLDLQPHSHEYVREPPLGATAPSKRGTNSANTPAPRPCPHAEGRGPASPPTSKMLGMFRFPAVYMCTSL